MFLNEKTREIHESNCPARFLGIKRFSSIDSLKLGTKNRDNILSWKLDEINPSPPQNITENAIPLEIPQIIQESLLNDSRIIDTESNERINRKIKSEQRLISGRVTETMTKTISQAPYSQKLESLIHTLILDNDQRLEIIVRRRSSVWKLKMKEFSISEFLPISMFSHILNEKFSQDVYENQFFVGEYTLYGNSSAKIELYSRFLDKFDSGLYVAVNNYYMNSHNEVLLICTNKTRFLGEFLKKGDISLLLFKYAALYNKVRVSDLARMMRVSESEIFRSPWVDSLASTDLEEGLVSSINPMEHDMVKKEKRSQEEILNYKKELLQGKNKNPFHFYSRDIEFLSKEEDHKEESVLDAEIEEMEKKCLEMRNLLNKKTEQYKTKLNELETTNQQKKNNIKASVQLINLFEKNKAEHANDLNNHDLLYKEDKKQFEKKFNEELDKQKHKYKEIYDKRVASYEGELMEKIKEFPLKEREYEDLMKDFDMKKAIFDQEQRVFNEIKAKNTELKKNFEKMANKQNFLEMHKKFNNLTGIRDDVESFDQDRCNFCWKERKSVVYLPCRHFVACQKCIDKAKIDGIEFCFTCKREVKQMKFVKWD